MKFLFPMASVLALAGCAQLGAVDCGPDWYSIGQRDGRIGALQQADGYARRCGVKVDEDAYLRGWRDGYSLRPHPTA